MGGALAKHTPAEGVALYLPLLFTWAHDHLDDFAAGPRLSALAGRIIDAASVPGLPLFAGWRAVPLPSDPVEALGLRLNVLREHRGACHGVAMTALGMTPLMAILTNQGGVENAEEYGWQPPFPEVRDSDRTLRLEVEELTDAVVARAYEALSESEQSEFVTLLRPSLTSRPSNKTDHGENISRVGASRATITMMMKNFQPHVDEHAPHMPDDADKGALDLEQRGALRRVTGLSTELQDVTEVEYRQLRLERVVLVGVWTEGTSSDAEISLLELAALAETAGSQVLEGVIQRRDKPSAATFIGSGKARELRDIIVATGADTVICDGELTPGQLRQLEEIVKVKVVDRTWLILDIFAQHAQSREGKAQVALAQMQYLLPRLRGWGESLSRQRGGRVAGGGGIGTRGPGETKIETDRRRINSQVARLRRELKAMETARQTKTGTASPQPDPRCCDRGLHQRR